MQATNYAHFYLEACFTLNQVFVDLKITNSKSKCHNTNGKLTKKNAVKEFATCWVLKYGKLETCKTLTKLFLLHDFKKIHDSCFIFKYGLSLQHLNEN